MSSSVISSTLKISLIEDATKNGPRIAAALEKVQQHAEALRASLAKSGLGDRMQADLTKVGASASQVDELSASWHRYKAERGLVGKADKDLTKAEIDDLKLWEAQALGVQRVMMAAEVAQTKQRQRLEAETAAEIVRIAERERAQKLRIAEQEERDQRRKLDAELAATRRAEHQRTEAIARSGIGHVVANGAAAAVSAHGVIHAAESSIEKGAELQHTRVGMEQAGIDAATREAIEAQALQLSARYGNVSQVAIMDLAKEARSVLKDTKEVAPTTAILAQAKSVLDAGDRTGGSSEGLGMLVKGAESIGAAQDPERLAKLIDGYVKAIQVMGKTINPEQIYQFDKYLKAEGARVSDRFLMTTGLSLAQEMGGSTAGKDIAQTAKDIIGGFQNKHVPLKEMARIGMIDRGDIEWVGSKNGKLEAKGIKAGHKGIHGADVAASDLDLWVYKYLLPQMEKKGIKEQQKQLDFVSKVFTGTEADVISKLITQRTSFENHALLYGQAKGLAGSELNRQLATAGLDAFTKALGNLQANATSPAMGAAGKALFTLADGINYLAIKAKDHPALAVTAAGAATAAGLAGSGYLAYKMVNGFGLKKSATDLSQSAILLKEAALAQGAKGGIPGALPGGPEGKKPSGWAKFGKALVALPMIEQALDFGTTTGNALGQAGESVIAKAQDKGLAGRATVVEMRTRQKDLAEQNAIWNDPTVGYIAKFMAGQRAEQDRRELDARGQGYDLAPLAGVRKSSGATTKAPVASDDPASPEGEDPPIAGARAGGGPVSRGKTYLVGEHGPELFTPGMNGAISTADVQRMLAKASPAARHDAGDGETASAVRALALELAGAVGDVARAVDRLRGRVAPPTLPPRDPGAADPAKVRAWDETFGDGHRHGRPKIDGARARGGPVSRGKTYLVGEHGPELFSPGLSGAISTHDVQRLLAHGSFAPRADAGDAETAKSVRAMSFALEGALDRVAMAVTRAAQERPAAGGDFRGDTPFYGREGAGGHPREFGGGGRRGFMEQGHGGDGPGRRGFAKRAAEGPSEDIPADGDSVKVATDLLKRSEGFQGTAKWDRNHLRLGFGSDTITDAKGGVHEVKAGDHVTREDAERDLARRIPEFQRRVAREVGAESWKKLGPVVQGALTSMAYNYGGFSKLPSMRAAIASGDKDKIAAAVRLREGDNGGINAKRREHEAQMIERADARQADGAPPVKPVAGGVGERLASFKRAGVLSNEQCVELARRFVGDSGRVSTWRPGEKADAGTLKPGTPVATFLNSRGGEVDRYADGTGGRPKRGLDHAAVFEDYERDRDGKITAMRVAEQYAGSGGVHDKVYPFHSGKFGEHDGSSYRAVKRADGSYLGGRNNPMSAAEPEPAPADAAKETTRDAPERPLKDPTGGPADADAGKVVGDLSDRSTYGRKNEQIDYKALVVHHTGSRGTPEQIVETLNKRRLGVQYVMDREGHVVRSLPEGARAAHILPSEVKGLPLNNGNTEGIEVIAKDDADVTKAQVTAMKRFYADQKKLHPGLQVFGHGYLNPSHKQATEGKTIVDAIRAQDDEKPDAPRDPIEVARAAAKQTPLERRTLGGYMGRDPTPAPIAQDDPLGLRRSRDAAAKPAGELHAGLTGLHGKSIKPDVDISGIHEAQAAVDHLHESLARVHSASAKSRSRSHEAAKIAGLGAKTRGNFSSSGIGFG